MNVKVTVSFIFNNVCNKEDLINNNMTLKEMVTFLIKEEGICSIIEDPVEVIKVEEIK